MFLDKALDEIGRKNKIVIGLDLTNDYVQISYCRLDQSMPDTVSLVMGEEQYNIPAVLCRKHQQEGQEEFWVIGKDALQTAKDGKGDLVEDLLLLVRNNTSAQVGDKEYTPRELMEIFFKKWNGTCSNRNDIEEYRTGYLQSSQRGRKQCSGKPVRDFLYVSSGLFLPIYTASAGRDVDTECSAL